MKSIHSRRRRYVLVVLAAATAVVMGGGYAIAAQSPDWSATEVPDLGENYALADIEIAAQDDVWAVGYTVEQTWSGTVALHWDGETWEHTPTPEGLTLQDAALTAEGDGVWAVGTTESGPLVAQWDGQEWQQIDTPDPEAPSEQRPVLYGVDADGSQPWAVGCASDEDQTAHTAFAQFYDGEQWNLTDVPLPEGAEHGCLRSVDHVASDEVWAVGRTNDGSSGEVFVVRWDGEQWDIVDMPEVEQPDSELTQVMAPGVGFDDEPEVYAAGFVKDEFNDPLNGRPALFTYDGEEWTQADVPDIVGWTYGLAPGPDGGAWMTGYTKSGGPMVMSYAGGEVESVDPPDNASLLYGVATGPDPESPTWVVGEDGEADEEMRGLAAYAAP